MQETTYTPEQLQKLRNDLQKLESDLDRLKKLKSNGINLDPSTRTSLNADIYSIEKNITAVNEFLTLHES